MATTVQQKPVLDKYGNIRLHALEGLDMPVKRKANSGDFIDISGFNFKFYVEGVGSFDLVAGTDDYEQRVQITPDQLDTMTINDDTRYALVDETGTVPVTVLEGKFKLEGFRVS